MLFSEARDGPVDPFLKIPSTWVLLLFCSYGATISVMGTIYRKMGLSSLESVNIFDILALS